jgi:hypothetical protein
VRDVEPLNAPHFATPLQGLRLHLLRAAPAGGPRPAGGGSGGGPRRDRRRLAQRRREGVPQPAGRLRPLDLGHLQIFVARPAYLLAMKCAATRLGEEFRDLDDVRYLLRYLNITRVEKALEIVGSHAPERISIRVY